MIYESYLYLLRNLDFHETVFTTWRLLIYLSFKRIFKFFLRGANVLFLELENLNLFLYSYYMTKTWKFYLNGFICRQGNRQTYTYVYIFRSCIQWCNSSSVYLRKAWLYRFNHIIIIVKTTIKFVILLNKLSRIQKSRISVNKWENSRSYNRAIYRGSRMSCWYHWKASLFFGELAALVHVGKRRVHANHRSVRLIVEHEISSPLSSTCLVVPSASNTRSFKLRCVDIKRLRVIREPENWSARTILRHHCCSCIDY